MDTPTNSILAGFITREELARQLGKSERTLARWAVRRFGPPVTHVGATPYYQIESARRALLGLERKPVRSNGQSVS